MRERSQFEDFAASELFCPTCRRAQPVRERLLLVLPDGNRYDYVCSGCGGSIGTKSDNESGTFDILRPRR